MRPTTGTGEILCGLEGGACALLAWVTANNAVTRQSFMASWQGVDGFLNREIRMRRHDNRGNRNVTIRPEAVTTRQIGAVLLSFGP